MPFPQSPRVVFRQNPIAEVICQLRFPAILQIVASPPVAFQEKVRRVYPVYTREENTVVPKELGELLAKLPGVRAPEEILHRFATADGKRNVALAKEFLAISDASYARWERFKENIRLAKAALEETYQPAFISRIGLRYRNVLNRERLGLRNRPWRELIRPQFVGLLGALELDQEVVETQGQTVVRLPEKGAVAVIRQALQDTEAGQIYTIDTDLFTHEQKEGDDVFTILDYLNGVDGNLFRWAIQPPLADALGPGAPD